MSARTVALDEEAYVRLERAKGKDETFRDAVKRLARPRRPLSEFAGAWGDLTAAEREALGTTRRRSRTADERRADQLRRRWSGECAASTRRFASTSSGATQVRSGGFGNWNVPGSGSPSRPPH